MELLHSTIGPIHSKAKSFFDKFEEYLADSDYVLITSGFISIESTLFLKNNLNHLPQIEIVAGMHAFDGFTRAQYFGFKDLAIDLRNSNKGKALICQAFPFHGKVYTFWKSKVPFAAILGSSNISRIDPTPSRIFELDLALEDKLILSQITRLQDELMNNACIDFLDYPEPQFNQSNYLMSNLNEVLALNQTKLKSIWDQATDTRFKLPLKCTQRSNLNVYFGKGRKNTKTGLVRPRPWYEIEIIVSKEITGQIGYPYLRDKFTVITDDGYQFEASTNGDYSKNFRSQGGLVILGTWIKGRLEDAGVLKVGEFIDPSILKKYGREDIDLIATDDPDIWLISFNREK